MGKFVLTFITSLLMTCMVYSQKDTMYIYKTDGTVESMPTAIIDSITFYPNKEADNIEENKKRKIKGLVQKGPYLTGSSLLISELDEDFIQTGRSFSTEITNNNGYFETGNINLQSRYIEIFANGFYYNEVSGDNSSAQLSLSAMADIKHLNTVNINILSYLEKARIKNLIENGMSFHEAKKQAVQEVLDIFHMEVNNISHSETLDIFKEGNMNAALLAISIILQGYRNIADLSELLSTISIDISQDGILNNKDLKTSLAKEIKNANLKLIRTQLKERIPVGSTVPKFEPYITNFIENSDDTTKLSFNYPKTGADGTNLLYGEEDRIVNKDSLYSFAVDMRENQKLKVILSTNNGGNYIIRIPEGREFGWISDGIYDPPKQIEKTLKPKKTEGICEVSIQFSSYDSYTNIKYKMEIFENGSENPTLTKWLYLEETMIDTSKEITVPEKGIYGTNLLNLGINNPDTSIIQADTSYSLALSFPPSDTNLEATATINYYSQEEFTIDTNKINHWQIIDMTDDRMELKCIGQDIKPDMEIIFHNEGYISWDVNNIIYGIGYIE